MKLKTTIIALSVLSLAACQTPTQYVGNGSANAAPLTMGIDGQDVTTTAKQMVESLLSSGALNKRGGGRYVVMISDVVNDTTQRFPTRILTSKIRSAMLRSGKAVVTAAVGTERDDTSMQARYLRGNNEFNQATVAKKRTLIAPELGLAGRIIQRIGQTDKGKQIVEYYFQLQLTNIKNGLVYWEDEVNFNKVGSNDSVIW